MKRFLRYLLPQTLFTRSFLIVIVPVTVLQILLIIIFYDFHWEKVTRRMADSIVGETAMAVNFLQQPHSAESWDEFTASAANYLGIAIALSSNPPTKRQGYIFPTEWIIEKTLNNRLKKTLKLPFYVEDTPSENKVLIHVKIDQRWLNLQFNRQRLFSSTIYGFFAWMIGLSVVLFTIAMLFLNNQIRPIIRLSLAMNRFGKGRGAGTLRLRGAREVRQATEAFNAMQDRISRFIRQRTDMLAAVSHDLRTPLTRINLALAMTPESKTTRGIRSDVAEMEHMIDGYLAFARGEGQESLSPISLDSIINEAVAANRHDLLSIHLSGDTHFKIFLRRHGFLRCLHNLLDNARRFANQVWIGVRVQNDECVITVEDNGPGVPPHEFENILKPFVCLDSGKNSSSKKRPLSKGHSGYGLGLTIVQDIILSHGGTLTLFLSNHGGLGVRMVLPMQ